MSGSPFTRHPVIYEDAHLLVIHKPSGVLSHPNQPGKGTLAAFEGAYDTGDRRFQSPAGPVWLLHRLDQEASGILLAAKTKEAATACREAFEKKEVEKDYLVLVSRRPIPPKGKWTDFLSEKKMGGGIKAAVTRGPKPNAILQYAQKEAFPKFNLALLEIRLVTGRTHQIRVQSAYHGHPVAGDRIYGSFTLNKELRNAIGLRRLFLHAWRLAIKHPAKSSILELEAPLPEELEQCLILAGNTQRSTRDEKRSR